MNTQLPLKDYTVFIGDIASALPAWLAEQDFTGLAVVCDTHTARHCRPLLTPLLQDRQPLWIELPAGEQHKQLATCHQVWDALFAANANRKWCVFNLGGGVIGDMGGFCAGTYKRGIQFVQIPTTLLSQVDASVGGKLGIDYGVIKNSVGLFRNPGAVFVDPAFLRTLPREEVRSGYAEILKHALIADAAQWDALRQITDLTQVDWSRIIPESVAIKKQIVEADPEEQLGYNEWWGWLASLALIVLLWEWRVYFRRLTPQTPDDDDFMRTTAGRGGILSRLGRARDSVTPRGRPVRRSNRERFQ